jgi:glycerol-3-phosphate dehydrogenase
VSLRTTHVSRLEAEEFDALIIGGGINGAVSAAALAARGVRVALIDTRDFAGFTSQQSSNLVWGGIKYMEGYEFRLVAGLCKSRNELLNSFPSTVKEIRFLMTLRRQFRFHPWIILASTWLYWLLGRGRTRTPRLLSLARIRETEPLIDTFASRAGVEYSDAFLHDNDARFVFNFVRSAIDKGCVAANYVESKGSVRDVQGRWKTTVQDQVDGKQFTIRSKILINATGAYVDQHNQLCGIETRYQHLLSKGIHLIVPQISDRHRVLAFFANDERLFFAIPMANRTCIGTTDTRVHDPITEVTDEDRDFVLTNINARLNLPTPLRKEDVIAERCGVRPLAALKIHGDSQNVKHMSRKHVIETSADKNHISIFGGKLTDCLNVGNEICDLVIQLGLELQPSGKWYGEPDAQVRDAFFRRAGALGLDEIVANDTREPLSERLWRRYAANADTMLDAIEQNPTLAEPLLEQAGIRRCEIEYLAQHEMIVKLEDYLRRRSKIELLISREILRASPGLHQACEILFGDQAQQCIDEYFK